LACWFYPTDAFGRSSLVACPAQSACSRHTIAGPKDRLAISETLRVHACSHVGLSILRSAHVHGLRRAICACSASERHHLSGSILPGVQPCWPAACGTEVLPLVRTSQSKTPFVSALRRRRQAIVGSRAGLREAPVGRTTLPLHPTGRRCLGRR
jgi:hypothetical protein